MSTDFSPGLPFPDIELDDHAGNRRALSELAGGDPVVLQFFRGWWCPKEQAFFRRLIALQDETEVAYSRIVSVSVDPPAVSAAFRAGLGARWTFLSDPARSVQAELRPRETSTTATTVWLRGRPFQWPAPAARYGRARARSPGRPGLLAAGKDFICFEPMTAPTNALRSGEGLQRVEPGDTFSAAFSIAVA